MTLNYEMFKVFVIFTWIISKNVNCKLENPLNHFFRTNEDEIHSTLIWFQLKPFVKFYGWKVQGDGYVWFQAVKNTRLCCLSSLEIIRTRKRRKGISPPSPPPSSDAIFNFTCRKENMGDFFLYCFLKTNNLPWLSIHLILT